MLLRMNRTISPPIRLTPPLHNVHLHCPDTQLHSVLRSVTFPSEPVSGATGTGPIPMGRPSHIRESKASLSDGLDNANGRYNSGEPRVAVTAAYKKAQVAIFLSSSVS